MARSELGRARVQDILHKWSAAEGEEGPLVKLERALTECRTFLRELNKEYARQKRVRGTALRVVLENLLLRLPSAEEEQLKGLQTQINEAARQLSNLEAGKVKGHRVRAGLKWEMEGDRPSAFFFQKLQEKRAKRTMQSLLDKTGSLHTNQKEMKKVIEDIYAAVFSSSGPDAEWQKLWDEYGHLMKEKVSERQRAILERPLTVEELEAALREMPSGKSPGHDGATKEFFSLFWDDLKGLIMEAVQDAWENGSFGEFFNKGLVCLCLKTGDLWEVKQWRPITLLTFVYKLVAKALAIRIHPFMDAWVEPEQRGFVAGRTIADNLLLFREAKWHAYATQQEVTFLQLDYSKAYDMLEWHFLHAGLQKLGFGPVFCRWVRILCEDAGAKIIVNGDLTRLIKLFRSVRQGCPLVPICSCW